MTLRILHIVHQYPPERVGGTELYTQTVARELAARGHAVAVFCPTSEMGDLTRPLAPQVEDGVRIYRVPIGPRSASAVFFSTFAQHRLNAAFQAVLRQERPQLVHVQHLLGLPVSLIDQVRAVSLPFVVTLHDYWYGCANAQLLTNDRHALCDGPRWWINCGRCALARADQTDRLWLAPLVAPLLGYRGRRLRSVLQAAQRLIAPTEFVRAVYQRLGLPIDRARVIPHGIEVPAALPPIAPGPSGELRVIYIGGVAWQKGVHVLIDAVNALRDQNVRLTIYGDLTAFPAYAAQLQQAARHPHIIFAGRLARADLWAVLRASDVVVVPSLWYETSSLIIQEAFAAQTPVIASDLGVLRERVRDQIDGLLFAAGQAPALRAVLQQCLSDRALLPRLRAAIQPVRTLPAHLADLEALYLETIAAAESA